MTGPLRHDCAETALAVKTIATAAAASVPIPVSTAGVRFGGAGGRTGAMIAGFSSGTSFGFTGASATSTGKGWAALAASATFAAKG